MVRAEENSGQVSESCELMYPVIQLLTTTNNDLLAVAFKVLTLAVSIWDEDRVNIFKNLNLNLSLRDYIRQQDTEKLTEKPQRSRVSS